MNIHGTSLKTAFALCYSAATASGCGSSGTEGPGTGQPQAGSAGTAPTTAGAAGSSVIGQAGTSSTGGASGSSGSPGQSGAGTGGALGGAGGASAGAATGGGGGASGAAQAGSAGSAGSAVAGATTEPFSFFVTSLEAVIRESKSDKGFGGNLGGLSGADAICTRIAEAAMPGAGAKGWRAFLSTSSVNAIERIGSGPWYDRAGRLVANNTAGLLLERPNGETTVNDLPNESGVPNRAGTGTGMDDNHDTITATNTQGKWDGGPTCSDWTSASGSDGPRVGHSWPANSGRNWMQAHQAPGCEPSVALAQTGAGSGNGIGNGGGYGGFYCFALKP